MRYLTQNCLLLLSLFIISAANAERKLQTVCADKSLHCKRRSHLCHSNAFRSVMQSVCKKTCNLCEYSRTEEIVEQDENEKEPDLDAEEGDEDADNNEYSESGTNTEQVDEEEVTVETTTILSTNTSYFTVKSEKQTVCTDLSTDCEGKRYLCSEQTYAHLMNKQCPKTCGVCQLNHRSDEQCQDRAPNCNKSLCDRQTYQQLMRSICKKTCSLC
ncbi:unnamed protein product [Onchocerca ochengi]|uniref:ShTK domain protein n=1 Tax=Onchocerca ochengi TaxID=42157 RepID=A0A182E8N0_ONCOC|nr:unnamed protein product [Onchocerca ochengi]